MKVLLKLVLILTLIAFSGCATNKSSNNVTTEGTSDLVLNNADADRVAQKGPTAGSGMVEAQEVQLPSYVKEEANTIKGASKIGPEESAHPKSYYLHGAEHLGLENMYFDFPVVYNEAVQRWLHYFQTRGRSFFERYSARAGRYAPVMGKILEEFGLPRDLIFLAMAESGFQNKAKSWARAVGPWQFMKFTGQKYGLNVDWYIDERMDPIKATIAACKYLSKLYNEFGSWELAAAAYNAGEGKVNRAIRKADSESFWNLAKSRYLKSETKNYVPKIMALAILGKNLKSFGFGDIDFHELLDFEEIDVPGGTDLFLVSEAIGAPADEIYRLNPEIMRWFVPASITNYKLRIPVGLKTVWDVLPDKSVVKALAFQTYTAQQNGAQLATVARKFKVAPYVLEHLNGMVINIKLQKGQSVTLPFRVGQGLRDDMYADLYELPRKSVLRRRGHNALIRMAQRKGQKIVVPSVYYTVQRGDTLWDVARKNNVSLDTLILSNMNIIKTRMIRAGDRLVVR